MKTMRFEAFFPTVTPKSALLHSTTLASLTYWFLEQVDCEAHQHCCHKRVLILFEATDEGPMHRDVFGWIGDPGREQPM